MKTKPTILLCIVLFTVNFLFAQKPANVLLPGSWKFTGNISCGNTLNTNNTFNIISFYNDHVFQIRRSYKPSDSLKYQKTDTVVETGTWSLSKNGKVLTYDNCHNIPLKRYEDIHVSEAYIRSVNDSCLLISADPKDNSTLSYYKRIPLLLPIKDDYNFSFYIVNSLDSTKKKKIDQYDISLGLKSGFVRRNLSGRVYQIYDSSLTFVVYLENNVFSKGDFLSKTEYIYGLTDSDSLVIQTINMKDLNYLRCISPTRDFIHFYSQVATFLSATTLLFVAPLVSINYKNGDFNSHRYYTWAGSGLAGVAICIPIMYLTRSGYFKMTMKNKEKDKKYWYFDGGR